MNPSKSQSSSKENDDVYLVGLEGKLFMSFFLEIQMIYLNKYCSQLDCQLKIAINKMHPECFNRKTITFHLDKTRYSMFL